MTSEEPLLNPPTFGSLFSEADRSGVNGFAQRFIELRSFAAENLRSREKTVNEYSRRARKGKEGPKTMKFHNTFLGSAAALVFVFVSEPAGLRDDRKPVMTEPSLENRQLGLTGQT